MKHNSSKVVIIDSSTGEVREGGSDLIGQMFKELERERNMFLTSDNPYYLVKRVTQNVLKFDVAEIKRMIDATFECACNGSPDAWYPNQYALGIAAEEMECGPVSISYFLSNFQLGLSMSAERAAKQLGQADLNKESVRLEARLNNPKSLQGLSKKDYRDLKAYVLNHPRLKEAVAWYEQLSSDQEMGGVA